MSTENENIENADNTEVTEKLVSDVTSLETEKKRGPKGPRPIVWICAGIDTDDDDGPKIVSDRYSSADIEVDISDMTMQEAKDALEAARDSFTEEAAAEAFADDHGLLATMVEGPFFERKGDQEKKPTRKRDTIRIPVHELRFSGKQREAIYNGWKGWANLLSDRDDVVYFLAEEEVNPDSEKKKVTPSPKNVLVSAIEFVN